MYPSMMRVTTGIVSARHSSGMPSPPPCAASRSHCGIGFPLDPAAAADASAPSSTGAATGTSERCTCA